MDSKSVPIRASVQLDQKTAMGRRFEELSINESNQKEGGEQSERALVTDLHSAVHSTDSQQDTNKHFFVHYPDLHTQSTKLFNVGERISRNLSLATDADRTHPMFWQFIESVQMLEEAMLGATDDEERY